LAALHFGIVQGDSQICREGEYTHHKQCSALDPALVFLWQIFKLLDDWGAAVAALAGIAVAVFTWTLWQSTEKLWAEAREQRRDARRGTYAALVAARAARASVTHAKESAAAELRAYLTVDEGKLFNVGTDEPWYAVVKIRNGGSTPAKKVRISCSIEGDDFPIQKEMLPIPEGEGEGWGILGPGAEYTLRPSMKEPVGSAKTIAMMSGNAIVWVAGRVLYEDIFGEPRWMTFRLFAGGELGKGNIGAFAPHKEGNDCN
jgi:hypothetical protein